MMTTNIIEQYWQLYAQKENLNLEVPAAWIWSL
jgi:hypothetical protein